MLKNSWIKKMSVISLMVVLVCSLLSACENGDNNSSTVEIDYSVLRTILTEIPMDSYMDENEMINLLESNNWEIIEKESYDKSYDLVARNGRWHLDLRFDDEEWQGPAVGAQFGLDVNVAGEEQKEFLTECYKVIEESYGGVEHFLMTGRRYKKSECTLEIIVNEESVSFVCVEKN